MRLFSISVSVRVFVSDDVGAVTHTPEIANWGKVALPFTQTRDLRLHFLQPRW